MALSGKNGKVTNSGATQIKEWSLDDTLAPLDITNFDGNGFMEFVEGLQGATGALTAVGTRPVTGSVTGLLLDAGQTTGDLRLSGNAIIGAIGTGVAVDGVVEFSVDFTINGALVVTTVP